MQDFCNIIDNFPIKAKVVIADIGDEFDKDDGFENVIEKEEGKPLLSHFRHHRSGSSFLQM